jgi:hypothetical protein
LFEPTPLADPAGGMNDPVRFGAPPRSTGDGCSNDGSSKIRASPGYGGRNCASFSGASRVDKRQRASSESMFIDRIRRAKAQKQNPPS